MSPTLMCQTISGIFSGRCKIKKTIKNLVTYQHSSFGGRKSSCGTRFYIKLNTERCRRNLEFHIRKSKIEVSCTKKHTSLLDHSQRSYVKTQNTLCIYRGSINHNRPLFLAIKCKKLICLYLKFKSLIKLHVNEIF